MAEKKYYIRVPEALVEVSEEVYKASRYMDRHFQTLEEKDARNRVFSYDALRSFGFILGCCYQKSGEPRCTLPYGEKVCTSCSSLYLSFFAFYSLTVR